MNISFTLKRTQLYYEKNTSNYLNKACRYLISKKKPNPHSLLKDRLVQTQQTFFLNQIIHLQSTTERFDCFRIITDIWFDSVVFDFFYLNYQFSLSLHNIRWYKKEELLRINVFWCVVILLWGVYSWLKWHRKNLKDEYFFVVWSSSHV